MFDFFASELGVFVLDLCRVVVRDVKINNVDMLVCYNGRTGEIR